MSCDMLALVTPNFILRFILRGVTLMTLVVKILRVHLHDMAANVARL